MGDTLQKLSLIVRSGANQFLQMFEGDGEAIMEQTIIDSKLELAKSKKAAGEVVADRNRYQAAYDKLTKDMSEAHQLALNVLKAGNETNAQRALAEEKRLKAEADNLLPALERAKKDAEMVIAANNKTAADIRSAEDQLRSVKRQNRVKGAMSTASKGAISKSSLAMFDRLASKSQAEYEAAMGEMEIANSEAEASTSVLDELRAEYGGSDTSDLDALRAELAGLN